MEINQVKRNFFVKTKEGSVRVGSFHDNTFETLVYANITEVEQDRIEVAVFDIDKTEAVLREDYARLPRFGAEFIQFDGIRDIDIFLDTCKKCTIEDKRCLFCREIPTTMQQVIFRFISMPPRKLIKPLLDIKESDLLTQC